MLIIEKKIKISQCGETERVMLLKIKISVSILYAHGYGICKYLYFISLHMRDRNLQFHHNTGHTQKNGAVSKEFTFDTAPFFCVCPVYM
jgi:hypothetical protein